MNTSQPNPAPYTPIREVNDTYYLSGVIGLNAPDMTAAADIAGQTRQAFANLKGVLESAGLNLNDVMKTTIFITDMSHYTAVNDIYITMFEVPRPARSCIAVAELPRVANVPLLIEIEAIAVRPN